MVSTPYLVLSSTAKFWPLRVPRQAATQMVSTPYLVLSSPTSLQSGGRDRRYIYLSIHDYQPSRRAQYFVAKWTQIAVSTLAKAALQCVLSITVIH
jgi:hypothetical protein